MSSCNAASIVDILQVNESPGAGSLSTALRAERSNLRRPADAIKCRDRTADYWGWTSITNLHKHQDWTRRHRIAWHRRQASKWGCRHCILSADDVMSHATQHYNVKKRVFCLYSRTYIVSPAMRPPQNSSQIYAYGNTCRMLLINSIFFLFVSVTMCWYRCVARLL